MWVAFMPGALTESQRTRLLDKIVTRANATADAVVRDHCLNCGIKVVKEWAARWLSGEDRSADAAAAARAAAAAYAADAARAAAAADAAGATYAARAAAAARTARAAGDAADAAECTQQVRDLIQVLEDGE